MILLKALLEQDKPKYTLFVDMDGVLVDFEKGYEQLTGVSIQQSNEQGKNKFWDLYRDSLEQKNIPEKDYWSSLSWMSDGQTLWDYVKSYNPYVLTAPSVNFDLPREQRYTREFNQSIQGKLDWVQRLDNMKNVYFKAARFKPQMAGPNKILIDDRKDTIDAWNAAGGIGILHTSTANTIEQLEKLGL
jgi:hypothetical protein